MFRRCVAEFLGTFAIVFFGCGAMATHPGDGLAINAVFGLTVAAAIYALGHISAAHFNPAVTVGFAIARRFAWRHVPGYIAAQVLGAVSASLLHVVFIGPQAAKLGVTLPSVDLARCVGIEATLTFFLMLVIIAVATDRRAHPAVPGLAIGMTVTLCGLFGGPLTGCSMNPARSLAPALFAGGEALVNYWVYLVGPLLGAGLAAVVYEAIRGGENHAQGAPADLAPPTRSV